LEADFKAGLGDAHVAAAKEVHRAFDSAGHQVAVRRLAVGGFELAAEVTGGHVDAEGEGFDVERLGVLTIDSVADLAQEREFAQSVSVR
jgi:hypothetical protein